MRSFLINCVFGCLFVSMVDCAVCVSCGGRREESRNKRERKKNWLQKQRDSTQFIENFSFLLSCSFAFHPITQRKKPKKIEKLKGKERESKIESIGKKSKRKKKQWKAYEKERKSKKKQRKIKRKEGKILRQGK